MKKYLVLFMILATSTLLYAQEFYICNFKNTTGVSSIRLVDEDFNVSHIVDVNVSAGIILDISFDSTGKLYGVTSINTIIEFNLSNGLYSVIHQFTEAGTYNSLTYDSLNDELITINWDTFTIYRFNLGTQTITSAIIIGISTPGDLTFYKGNLIFQDASTSDFVTYDGFEYKTIACGFNQGFFGFSNYTTSCNTNYVYAFGEFGLIYQYNVEDNNYQLIGDITTQTDFVYGSATINEYQASNCPLVNLDEVDCDLSVNDNNLSEIEIYPNPTTGKIFVSTNSFYDNLYYSLYTIDGKLLETSIFYSEINLENLTKGIYILELHNELNSESVIKRIIKY